MTEALIVRDLGLALGGAAALLVLARLLRLPSLLAYIVAGLVLGPVLGLLTSSPSLELFSELGVALLLFVVGMELGFEKIRAIGGVAVMGGILQVALTTALAGGLVLLLDFPLVTAALLGAAVAISSTVVVVKLLERTGSLNRLHGRLAIGILLVQDIVVAILLTLLSALGSGSGATPLAGVLGAFLGVGVLVAGAWAGVRTILPRLLGWMGPSPEGLFIVGLSWAFLFIVAAEQLHISIELGALIAGVAVAQLPENEELRRRVHPLVDLFLAVFFVGLGISMDPTAVVRHGTVLLVLSLFVVVGKPVLIAGILSLLGQPRRESLLAGLTLGQVSEFSLILIGVAAAGGLVGAEVMSILALLALVSIAASAFLVPAGPRLLEAAGRTPVLTHGLRLLPARALPPEEREIRSGHIVVVGMNALGRQLVESFHGLGHRVLAVDTDSRKLAGLPGERLQGSADDPEVLEEADVDRARLVISALQVEDTNLLLTHRCESMGVPVSVHAFDPTLAHTFMEMGADHVMIPKLDGIQTLEARVRERGVIR